MKIAKLLIGIISFVIIESSLSLGAICKTTIERQPGDLFLMISTAIIIGLLIFAGIIHTIQM